MAIADDISVAVNGDIRYTGSGTTYTVVETHRFLSQLADDQQASGDDLVDITTATPSVREGTDNFITLNSPFNIDDTLAQYLYDGSIVQDGGDTIYDGIVNYGTAGILFELIQDKELVVPNFWGTGINANATLGISHRFLVKVRTGGTDIDNRRLWGVSRVHGKSNAEFQINGSNRGNNTLALSHADDINNVTAEATVAGYTGITNTEGYRAIDVDNDSTDEYYFSEWNTNQPTRSINEFYERMKWVQRMHQEDLNADTGSDFSIGPTSIVAQGQSFSVGTTAKVAMKVTWSLKKVASPTGNATATIYAHTGSFGSTGTPTGAALATSDTFDVATLTTSYQDIEFKFATAVTLSASTNYFVAVEYAGGDGTDYIQVEGLASSGTHAGNRAEDTGSWAASGSDDLNFDMQTSVDLYGIPGILFRGITHEIDVDGILSGPLSAVEELTWTESGTPSSGIMVATDSVSAPTKVWIQLVTGIVPTDGTTMTGTTSSATVDMNTTILPRNISLPWCGASTGTALIGAYGFGVEAADLAVTDSVIDLGGNTVNPPNNVTFTVNGLSSGEDYILVTNDDTGLDYNQLTLNTDLTGGTETAIVATAAIPVDTPAAGTIRVQLDTLVYRYQAYNTYTGSTFAITSADYTDPADATGAKNIFVSYIDKAATSTSENFSTVYNGGLGDRTLFIRVRYGDTAGGGPIKTVETTGILGSTGGSVTISRLPDA